ncbi:MAG: rhomboid family intramembrane serine protease [Clostridiales bacterium]|nr:rhomboid family intramembrane serine protease [Clostridiales bacterium]
MKFFDYSAKNVNWRTRNYFFAGTLFLIILQIVLFAIFGAGWSTKLFDSSANYDSFSIQNFFNGIFGSFDHVNWQHILLNMLCFLFCGIYMERKQGTLIWIPFVLITCILSRMANMLVLQFNWIFSYGFSSCNYALYAVIILDIIFNFAKIIKLKFETIWSIIFLLLIYFAMCFNGGTSTVSFVIYPYDFIYNSWHWSGFLTGILIFFLTKLPKADS